MKQKTISNILDLATLLKERRAELKITQTKLGQYCNLTKNAISKIETGDSDVHLSTLIKMSKFLGYKIKIELEE